MAKDFWKAEYERIRFTKQWSGPAVFRSHVERLIGVRPDGAALKFCFKDSTVVTDSFHWEGAQAKKPSPEACASKAQEETTEESPLVGNMLQWAERQYKPLLQARGVAGAILASIQPHLEAVVAAEEVAAFYHLDHTMMARDPDRTYSEEWRGRRKVAYEALVRAALAPIEALRDSLPPEMLAYPEQPVQQTSDTATLPAAPVVAKTQTPSPAAVSAPVAHSSTPAGGYVAPVNYPFEQNDYTLADPWLPFLIETLLQEEGAKLLVVPTAKMRDLDQLTILLARISKLYAIPLKNLAVVHADSATTQRIEAVPTVRAVLFIGRSIPTRARQIVIASTRGMFSVTASEDATIGNALRNLNQMFAERALGYSSSGSLWVRALRLTYRHRKNATSFTEATILSLMGELGLRTHTHNLLHNARLANLQIVGEHEGLPKEEIQARKDALVTRMGGDAPVAQ